MPVFDLRNTLGLPQEAPQQPVFDRTRQFALGSPEYNTQQALQIAHQFETQAPLVRANQGLAYLGAIQNQQAQIAQQAQNLRLQQEAQMAAQRATQGLAGITPDHPEYLNQRQKVLQQNPNALLDPQFRNALHIYDQGYENAARQRQLQANQLAAQQKQAHSLGLRAIEYGAHPHLVAEHVEKGNLGALAQMAGEARRNSMVKAKAEPVDYRTKEAYQAYLKAIQDDNPDAVAKIDEFARKGGFHWETPVAPTAATATPTPAAAPQTSQWNQVKGGGMPEASKNEIQKMQAEHVGAPGADENFYTGYIANPNVPLHEKQRALQEFEKFVKNPPKKLGASIGAGMARRKLLEDALTQAKEDVAFHPVREQFSNDWQKSKDEMSNYVRKFADYLGVDESEAAASLKSNEELNIAAPGDQPKYERTRPLFESFMAKHLGIEKLRPFLRLSDERLGQYSNHPFASRLGVKPFSIPGFPNAGKTLGVGQQPVSNENVLDRYLDDLSGAEPAFHQPAVNLPRPATPADAAKLPPGTKFISPDGQIREVPVKQ